MLYQGGDEVYHEALALGPGECAVGAEDLGTVDDYSLDGREDTEETGGRFTYSTTSP